MTFHWLAVAFFLLGFLPCGHGQGYVVAVLGREDLFSDAVKMLAQHRNARVVVSLPDQLEPLLAALREHRPEHVAYFVAPEVLDLELARRLLVLSTKLDEDPFVDFSYGFFTGATSSEVLDFVKRTMEAEGQARELSVADLGVWELKKSRSVSTKWKVRGKSAPRISGHLGGGEHFGSDGRDLTFLHAFLPKLCGVPLIIFGGHGVPQEILGGPRAEDVALMDLKGAIVLNIACYTGVTHAYYDLEWEEGVLRRRTVPKEKSFCLEVLRRGVLGYTAYLGPRPSGPELETDLASLAFAGMSLGEVRRRDYDKLILGYVAKQALPLVLSGPSDGQPITRSADVVGDLMLDMGTGGVLFGDPAFRPFPTEEPVSAVRTSVLAGDHGFEATLELPAGLMFQHAADPTTSFDGAGALAMKLLARVPLGDHAVGSVSLESVEATGFSWRRVRPDGRVLWAVEEDQGQRFLHLKALLRWIDTPRNLSAKFRVRYAASPAEGRSWSQESK